LGIKESCNINLIKSIKKPSRKDIPFFYWLILFLVIVGIILWGERSLSQKATKTLTVGRCQFDCETAQTLSEKKRGLSGREALAKFSGMLFLYDSATKRSFWMNDMSFPIDIIWIRGNKVVDLSKNVPVLTKQGEITTILSQEPIDGVLEINSGMIQECQIKVGDQIK
jgi:uncharacterized protein